MGEHWFWWLMTMACVVWYSTITVYVAIRGAVDIKTMLARLDRSETERNESTGGTISGPDSGSR
ncbi:MAG: hypothetical protein NTW96_17245 [Planctomycetia bacterium]|nr:hypothetical protein [Planctomycetia bacterium]